MKKRKRSRREDILIGLTAAIIPLCFILFGIVAVLTDYVSLFGAIGTLFVGTALFLFVSGFLKSTIGFRTPRSVCLFVFLIGVAVILTDVLLFGTEYYQNFRQTYGTLYLLNFLAPFLAFIVYCSLIRPSIKTYYRMNGFGKSAIKTSQKGYRNYFWYRDLHRQMPLGILYAMNLAFTLLLPVASALHFLVGWWGKAIPVVSVVNSVTSILCGITLFIAGHKTRYAVLSPKEKRSVITGVFGFLSLCLLEIWIGAKLFLLIL